MSALEIYDTNGNRYEQGVESKDGIRLERIESLFKDGIKIAIEKEHDKYELYLYIRAKPSKGARSEQYFARYRTRDTDNFSPREVCDKIEKLLENEWGYTVDKTDEYYQCFCSQRSVLPGDSLDRRTLERLIDDNKRTVVGVQDASAALGLLNSTSIPDGQTAVIAEAEPNSVPQWGLAITTGRHSGIQPLGRTEKQWEQARDRARRRGIQDQISSIRDSVSKLSDEYQLSNSEIRNRVHNDIPTLRSQSNTTTASNSRNINTTQDRGGLVPNWALSVLAIGLVLFLLAAAVVGGLIYFDILGSDSNTLVVEVSGAEGGESIEEARIEIEPASEEMQSRTNTTNSNGTHEFSGLESGPYDLTVGANGYENNTIEKNLTSDDRVTVELDKTTSTITVVDAEDGEPIEDAAITVEPLQGEGTTEGTTSSDGTYEISGVDSSEYDVVVTADGYGSNTEQMVTTDEAQRIELWRTIFEAKVTDSTGEPLQDITVGFINEDNEYITTKRTDNAGYVQFTAASDIPEGTQTVGIESDEYKYKKEDHEIPADTVVSFELSMAEN